MKIRSLVEGLGVIGVFALLGAGIYVALTSIHVPLSIGAWGVGW